MSNYRREIATELESLDDNAFDAASDTIKLDIEKAEDVAFTNADKGIVVMAVRDDTPPTAKGANDDYMPLLVDSIGRLYTNNKEEFGGAAFSEHYTSGDSDAVAFGAVKLRDVVITNSGATNDVTIGENNTAAGLRLHGFDLSPGASVGFVKIDLATLFLCSQTAAAHTTVQILGVEE